MTVSPATSWLKFENRHSRHDTQPHYKYASNSRQKKDIRQITKADHLPVTSPKLPADEPLQRRVGLVHQGPSSRPAEPERISKRRRLPVIEDVALSIIRRRTAGRLIPKLRTPFYRQRLVGVDECFANRQLTWRWRFQVDAYESPRHWRVAWQE